MSEYIYEARKRIRQIRMTDVEITVLKDGKPVENAAVSLRMKNHQFLFGAVCYAHGKLGHPGREERFTREFTKLMNYTMVPYHWQWYEPERGVYAEPYTGNLVRWATEQGLKKKLHALIWHELCPDWVTDENVEDAKLLYGDWNVHGEEYFDFLRTLRENDVDIDIIGMQSHQHRDLWTQEETLRVMDRAAEFGWPIHFPECSVCSGKPIGEMNYGAGAVNRFSETEEDLYWQADFTKDFYTLVFSHPAVEALSWFDFTDHRWLNAPAGLVDDDLNPKPVYAALDDLINRQWHTDADLTTSTAGICGTRLFFGTYEITVEAAGVRKTVCRDILRPSFYEGGGLQKISVNL